IGDMPSSATLTCAACGRSFTLPDAVRQRYPNWTPKNCMDCRDSSSSKSQAKRPAPRRRSSATREQNLTLAEVTERFTDGPQTGIFTDGSCQGNPGPGGWGAVHVREGMVLDQ